MEEIQIMMTRGPGLGVLVLSIIMFAGCSVAPKYRPELPEEIGGKGIVVGEVVGINRLSGWSTNSGNIVIGKKTYTNGLVKGLIAVPFDKGEYSLDALNYVTYGGSTTNGNVTYTTKYSTTMPLNRKFTIWPGEVTNIGLILLYPDPEDKENKRFFRFFIDNRDDMKRFLKTFYPALSASMKVDAMTLSAGEYLKDPKLLQALRRDIALKEFVASRAAADYVAGNVGTVAKVKRGKDGKISDVQVLDVETLSNIVSKSSDHNSDRLVFMTANNRLFLVTGGAVKEKRPPAALRDGNLYALGSKDIVIVDDLLEIYVSNDNGETWKSSEGFVVKEPVKRKFVTGERSYYVYSTYPPVLIAGAYGKTELAKLVLPEKLGNIQTVTEKKAGLFVETHITAWTKNTPFPFYVKKDAASPWETRAMPMISCYGIRFLDDAGNNLETLCLKETFQSSDGGRRWTKK